MNIYRIFLNIFFGVKYLLFFVINVTAQVPLHHKFDVSTGIRSNVVYDILFDQIGFLWLTTEEGLMRFDGHNFKSYTYVDNKNRAGSSLQTDTFGRIWYQSFDGNIFYLENDTVKIFNDGKDLFYSTILIDGGQLIYVDNNNELVSYNILKLKNNWKIPLEIKTINTIKKFKGRYYLGGDRLYEVNIEDRSIRIISDLSNIISIFSDDKHMILQVSKKNQHILYTYVYEKIDKIYETSFKINFAHYWDDNLYISGDNGLYILKENSIKIYFDNVSFSKILIDKRGQIFAATTKNGLIVIPRRKDYEYISLNNNSFTSIFKNNDDLYVGTENGSIFHLRVGDKTIKVIYEDSLKRKIYSFLAFPDKKMMFIALDNEVIGIHNKVPVIRIKNIAPKDLKLIDGKYILVSYTGSVGFLNYVLDKNIQSSWDSLFANSEVYNGIKNIYLKSRNRESLYLDDKKMLLLSTSKGQIFIDTTGKIVKIEKEIFQRLFSIGEKILGVDFNNNLFQFDREIYKFKICAKNVENKIKNVAPGDIGVYISAHDKLYDFLNGSIIESSKFAESNIIRIFEKENFLVKITTKRILHINKYDEKYTIDDKKVFINAINGIFINKLSSNFSVENYNKNILVDFSYLNLDLNNYSNLHYRINSSEWQELNAGVTSIFFPVMLHPSIFKIDFGIKQNEQMKILNTFNIEIFVPFYKRPLFLFFLQFLIFSSIVSYIYWQISLYKKKNSLILEKSIMEMNLSKMTLKSIKSQMNPHFFFNALNTIQAFIYSNDRHSATYFLRKFSKLTRMILENSEEDSISLRQELSTIELYLQLEKIRFSENFSYCISIDDFINLDEIYIPTMMIQPYVENSIKHGLLHKNGDKKIMINIRDASENIVIEIVDNGIGLRRSAEINALNFTNHKSFSTNANFKRIEILNKIYGKKYDFSILELFDENNNSKGTKVILIIPKKSE